jgi:hypothetical protein
MKPMENKMTAMRQLFNQMREERTKQPLVIEWDRCYRAIEMMIEHTYIPMEKEQILSAHNQGYADGYRDNGNSPIDYYNETYKK